MIVSMLIGHWLIIDTLSIFLVIALGMAIPTALRMNPQIISQVAVSSLLVLAFADSQGYALGRIVETIVGCAVAIAVNAIVVPPNALPFAESSLTHLSKRSAATIKALVPLLEKEPVETDGSAEVNELVQETEKAIQALHLAKQSQKYSPFLHKVRARLEHLAFGIYQLERVTVQIRGIRRSLLDLREAGYDTEKYEKLETFREALQSVEECVDHFGDMIVHSSVESDAWQAAKIEAARSIQSRCLADMTGVESLPLLREMGAILTDLSRILKEVSPVDK